MASRALGRLALALPGPTGVTENLTQERVGTGANPGLPSARKDLLDRTESGLRPPICQYTLLSESRIQARPQTIPRLHHAAVVRPVQQQLLTIGDHIRQTYPEKKLESFVRRVLARLPRVLDARSGPDVDGADLVLTFDAGIESLDLERTEVCAVQVKCYEDIIDDTRAIDDIS